MYHFWGRLELEVTFLEPGIIYKVFGGNRQRKPFGERAERLEPT